MRSRDRHLHALAYRLVGARRLPLRPMSDRLPAHLEASALVRGVEAEGGFGMILKKGDPDRGALVLLIASRGEHRACLERALSPDGKYRWQQVGPKAGA